MNYRKLTVLCLGFIGLPALAAETQTIVITSGRQAEPLDQVIPATTLVTRTEIEQSPTTDIADLIRQHAGIEIGRNGGPGQQSSVFIRGTESNHTLIMLDGISINPGTIGNAGIQNIHPDQVERIEIVKGPASTLYGSSALGGVINIITRKSSTPGTSARANFATGSDNTKEISAGLNHRTSSCNMGLDLTRETTDGFPSRQESSLDRGHKADGLKVYAEKTFSHSKLGLQHWQTKGSTEYLDFALSPVDQDFINQVSAITLNTDISDKWISQLKLSRLVDKIEQNQSTDFLKTQRYTLDWQNNVQLSDTQLITAGFTSSREETASLSFGAGFDETVNINEIFIQDTIELANHRVVFGGRYTDHEIVGNATTWNTAWEYSPAPSTRFTASAGTGYRFPDSSDLYGFGGNPDLNSEKSTSYELSLRHGFSNHHKINLTLFQTRIKHLIQYYDPDGFLGPLPGQNTNLERARINGLELGYSYQRGPWQISVEALLQDPEDPDSGRTLARRAKENLTASFSYLAPQWDARMELTAASKRNDSAYNTLVMDAYEVVNLSARYHLSSDFSLEGRILNLFDEEYELASGYNTQDRAVYLGLRWNTDNY